MITVRLGAYSSKATKHLKEAMEAAHDVFLTKCCGHCLLCANRIPCNDLYEVVGYLNKKIKEDESNARL